MFRSATNRLRGVTILEVLASAVVILLGLGAIFGMNAQSLQILRKAQQAAAASQILQERIETLRTRPWPEIARASAAVALLNLPTDSASDLADSAPTETLTISPTSSPSMAGPKADYFKIERRDGQARVLKQADLTDERLLLVELSVSWREQQRTVERRVRTIIGRAGLTRSGIFGSAFGRVAPGSPASP